MPNPNHDPENGQFTTPPAAPPEPQAPAQDDPWAQVREAGITPEQAMNGGRLYADLNNLDRRQQALQSVIRPDIDTWIGRHQEDDDPYAQFGADDYDEPQHQAAPFDPQEYARQIVEMSKQESMREFQGYLQNMMMETQFSEAAKSVVSQHNLPPGDAMFIEQQAKALAQQQPNRAPSDIANELAQKRANELAQWAQAAGAVQPQVASPAAPGGPVPSPHQGPPPGSSMAELERWALERSREGLG